MPSVISELTGEPIDTSSAQWLHECECSWLLTNKPTKAEKHLYLYGVRDRATLFDKDGKLINGYEELLVEKRPLMKFRNLAAADRILEDARKMHEARLAHGTE